MGGSLGCHRSIPRDPSELGRKLSAACNFGDVVVKQQLELQQDHPDYPDPEPQPHQQPQPRFCFQRLDINACTEEELMTLPGVTRCLARNIVRHRARIGGFRRVEDLALVSGVGAARLERVKPEICVLGGSPCPSLASSCSLSAAPQPTASSGHDSLPAGGPAELVSSRPEAPLELQQQQQQQQHNNQQLQPLLRLATWDLQRCSSDKANNPGVREVVCMTLLENRIKLLAVQDLADREALNKFCAELNQPSLFNVRKWKSPRGVWKCAASEKPTAESSEGLVYAGFLWDSSAGVEMKDAVMLDSTVANGNGHNQSKAFLAQFYVGSSELTLVNVHFKPPALPKEQNGRKHGSDRKKQHRLSTALQDTLRGVRDVLVLGGFGQPPDCADLDSLKKEKLTALLPPSIFTNISTRSPQGTSALDNIWASRSIKKIYTGHCSVIREGLTNPWIPDNWSWGGVASDHCPVMAEFYLDVYNKEPLQNGSNVAVLEREDIMPKHER